MGDEVHGRFAVPCPRCMAGRARQHCDSNDQCNWVTCTLCHGIGTTDGTRWITLAPDVPR